MAAARMVFGDEIVTATQLNRRPGDILDQAWEKCVTIMRNDQAFALLRRDWAADITAELGRARLTLDLLQAIVRVCSEQLIEPTHQFEWITAFGPADLKLMANEIYCTYARARNGEIAWEEFDAVLHEWQESAWAIRSHELREAFLADADEVPLTSPPVPPKIQE